MGGDSCLLETIVGAAFGATFGGMVGAATATFLPSQSTSTIRGSLSYVMKTSTQYSVIATTFCGASCLMESISGRKGPHNNIFGGLSCGVAAALLSHNYKHGLALGGTAAILFGALDYAGGTFDSRQDKDFKRLAGLHSKGGVA
jgi:hypothetical protein